MTDMETARATPPPGSGSQDGEIRRLLNLDLRDKENGHENQAKTDAWLEKVRARDRDKRRVQANSEAPSYTLIIGFDSEYVQANRFDPNLPETENIVLSYQLAAFTSLEDDKPVWTGIHLTTGRTKRNRLSLSGMIGGALEQLLELGALKTIPDKIKLTMVGHFTRADLTTLRDFPSFKTKIDSLRKTHATVQRPTVIHATVKRKSIRVSITFADTMLLAPAGSSLNAIGELIGRPKIELPEGAIERMDSLLRDDPELFTRYALEDAVIAGLYYIRQREQLAEKFGVTEHKPTLGSVGVAMIVALFKELGLNLKEYCGYEGAGKKKQWLSSISEHIAFMSNAYHGGLNQAYFIGVTPPNTPLYDVDIKGAYTTAMALLREPDWPTTKIETDIKRLAVVDDAMTLARVKFEFPANTRFPCLPVRTDDNRGLVYPLSGVSYCTGPELVVALSLGAKLDIEHGLRVEWKDGELRPFEQFTRLIGEIRAKAPKNGMLDKTAKEIGNSAYGKEAQGVQEMRSVHDNGVGGAHGERVFDSRTQEMKTMPASKITNPMLAAFVTGVVRGLVSEALAALPSDALVCTATTDGFLSNIPVERLDVGGPVAKAFALARARITPKNPAVWEQKHCIRSALVLKTRGTISIEPFDMNNPGEPVLARAGHRLERRDPPPWEECSEWVRLIRERDYETRCQRHALTSLRDQNLLDCDLVGETTNARMNFDYDLKHQPTYPFDRDGLLCADTRPWPTLEDFTTARDGLEAWKKSQRRVLKTLEDYKDMFAWSAARESQRASGGTAQSRRPPLVNVFLKAATRGLLNLNWSHDDIIAFFKANGYPLCLSTVKMSKRRGKLALEQISELTPAELQFAKNVYRQHPEIVLDRLVAPGSAAAKTLADLRSSAICEHCGGAFTRQRASARYCGPTCRSAANRRRKGHAGFYDRQE
jgi:hypothetical protein